MLKSARRGGDLTCESGCGAYRTIPTNDGHAVLHASTKTRRGGRPEPLLPIAMLTTTRTDLNGTKNADGEAVERGLNKLVPRFRAILKTQRLNWTCYHRFDRRLGSGGQGVVFLSERRGADRFVLPVAIKVFSPERYATAAHYQEAMERMAQVACCVARIQQDNLLDVHNFADRESLRIMVMEWVDGYDLCQLQLPSMLSCVEGRVSARRWEYLNRVVVTRGPEQALFRPGVAVAVVRGRGPGGVMGSP